jgi:recombination protein RecA
MTEENTEEKDDKLKSIKEALALANKAYGQGSIMRLGSAPLPDIDVISTGSLNLDRALGIGGLPKGRIVEIYGENASGKTSLCLHLIANCQADGGRVLFVDAEHALNTKMAANLGVMVDEIYLSQPTTGEQGLNIVDMMLQKSAFDLIVVDSVAALVPEKELMGEIGDSLPGLHARMMSQAMRKITGSISKNNALVVFINQTRTNIGGYGNPVTQTGGKALAFYSSVRLEVKRKGYIKDKENVIGINNLVKVVKNKMAPAFREAEYDFYFDKGIDFLSELIDLSLLNGVIKKGGAWFDTATEEFGKFQGKDSVREALSSNPEFLTYIKEKNGMK